MCVCIGGDKVTSEANEQLTDMYVRANESSEETQCVLSLKNSPVQRTRRRKTSSFYSARSDPIDDRWNVSDICDGSVAMEASIANGNRYATVIKHLVVSEMASRAEKADRFPNKIHINVSKVQQLVRRQSSSDVLLTVVSFILVEKPSSGAVECLSPVRVQRWSIF